MEEPIDRILIACGAVLALGFGGPLILWALGYA